jgi:hypothetical protein
MRRFQAIALVLALMVAPLALFAGSLKCACAPAYCTMTHGFCDCPMMQHMRESGSKPMMCCDCMRFPSLGMLTPLEPMILVPPVPQPAIVRSPSGSVFVALVVLPGFLPSPFHPPR